MTARAEILMAIQRLERRHRRDAFSPAEILQEVRSVGTVYKDSTIRTHITSAMCVDAPPHHAVRYPDLERIGPAAYRRIAS